MPTLDFKGKDNVFGHHLSVPFRTLESDPAKSVGAGATEGDGNLIIHGDNLDALKALLPRYAGRVNCVYIDPPYNTGNEDWSYNDNVNSPLMRRWLKENGAVDGEDQERHDKWLCMMWPRLHLLRDLLAEDGVIFISIDDNEQHHLRAVMDEIFGESNFVATIVWRKKAGGGQDSRDFAREHEYILCYRKSPDFELIFRMTPVREEDFKKEKNGRKCDFVPLEKWGSNDKREDRPTMYYAIKDPDGNDFYPRTGKGRDGNWRKNPRCLDDEHIHWEKNRAGVLTPYEVIYFDEAEEEKVVKDRTIFYDLATTTDAAKEQQAIFGEKVQENSKPVGLVYRILQLGAGKDGLVLDSFAGTGTTAHAVLRLNKEDGGNRRFVLVECEDYADTRTAERVRRVIKGVPDAKDEATKAGLGGGFTFCTLGEEMTPERLLGGKDLPSYEALARHVAHVVGGGVSLEDAKVKDDWFVVETSRYRIHLIYRPDLEFMRGRGSALSFDFAEQVGKAAKAKGKTALVFATMHYAASKDMRRMGTLFLPLPRGIRQMPEA